MAESISARVAWKLKKAIVGKPTKGTSSTGTASFVRTDDDGVSWVRLPGASVDTPVNGNLVADMQSGDTVSYRIDGGRLSVTGNATSPSVGGTYVANTVAPVAEKADIAISDALRAHEAADLAEINAARAQASATSASEYASRALGNLSTVQSVAETLAWITEHGTMTPTADTAPDPTHVYFVADSSGDYSVGGSTYSVVTEPDASDMATYYELSIDESLNNYVGTHLAVTDEGLWVIPAASGGYKILIATGSGTTYTTAGTYIIDSGGTTVAFFGTSVTIGEDSEGHASVTSDGMAVYGSDGTTRIAEMGRVFQVRTPEGMSTLNVDSSGAVGVSRVSFALSTPIKMSIYTSGAPTQTRHLTLDLTGIKQLVDNIIDVEYTVEYSTFAGQMLKTEHMTFTYGTSESKYMFDGGTEGTFAYSYVRLDYDGSNDITCEWFSQSRAGGNVYWRTFRIIGYSRSGEVSLPVYAIGSRVYKDVANNDNGFSATIGRSLIASSPDQLVTGHCNAEDASGTYAHVIGNGTSDSSRSNAFTVDWSGNVEAAGNITASNMRDIAMTIDIGSSGTARACRIGNMLVLSGSLGGCTVSDTYTWTHLAHIDPSDLGITSATSMGAMVDVNGGGPSYFGSTNGGGNARIVNGTLYAEMQTNAAFSGKYVKFIVTAYVE